MMTLDQFRSTGRNVESLRDYFKDETFDEFSDGRVYAGEGWIEHVDNDSWGLRIANCEWIDSLAVCESILYLWACTECGDDVIPTQELRELIGRFIDQVGDHETVATWIAAHPDDSCADDFMDVSPVAAEVYGDNHELDEDGIDALIAAFNEWAEQGAFATDETRSDGR